MAMFKKTKNGLSQVKEIPFKKEKDLQTLTEENLNLTSENTPTVIYIPDESIFAER